MAGALRRRTVYDRACGANRPIQSSTITQYISHCVTGLLEVGCAEARHLRSPQLTRVLQGFHRQDLINNPRRLHQEIPAICSIASLALVKISAQLGESQPSRAAELRAALTLTYTMALRPNEGAARTLTDAEDDADDSHHVRANLASVRFKGDATFYQATAPALFPTDRAPESIDILQDHSKTSMSTVRQRGAEHKSTPRNPYPDGRPFDAVLEVLDYLRRCPPAPGGALFPNVTSADIGAFLKAVAVNEGLDPARLTTRALRSGAATMMRNLKTHSDDAGELDAIQQLGGWTSTVGNRVYAHSSPSELRAPSLYNDGFMTIAYLRWFYMSAAH